MPLLLAGLALAGAMLACTLSFGESGPAPSAPGDGGGAGSGNAPTVRIVDPPGGAQVPPNERVTITVETDSTATSFMLSADGRVAGTTALPPGQSGPTTALLSWQPVREGLYSLEVVAFNGQNASAPAALTLEVTNAAAAAGAAPGTGAGCTGTVMVSRLNFRAGPGTAAQQLGQFDAGETVTIVGRNADTSWYSVRRANAQQVWVINNPQWFQVAGSCEGVPVTE